ncbi:LAMI_0B00518g1_1 [Lachancea mirantina]|uniref:Protein IBD2 n=1 Tax=Lachancea mirantina TaxID=1230905 RepID=A0A1G4ITJ3_9SACH|nr:LAMI_0B00518g1_1 [Lachancea mirantina]
MAEKGTASIELVSEDGPVDFNVMMQKGVTALTKLLQDRIQEDPDYLNQSSMKFVLKNNTVTQGEIGSQNSKVHKVLVNNHGTLDDTSVARDISVTVDGGPDVSLAVDTATGEPSDPVSSRGIPFAEMREEELLFDYGEAPLPSIQQEFGENINNLISSMLPPEMANNSNIKDLQRRNSKLGSTLSTPSRKASSYCRRESQSLQKPSDFYYLEKSQQRPDFSCLTENKPLCLFCEYFFVFGTLPKNMLKWYSRMQGDEQEPCENSQCEKHHKR